MRSLLAIAACAVALACGTSVDALDSASVSAALEVVPGTPAGEFPYTFPYCPDTRCIVSDFALQEMRLYEGETVLKRMKMSSAAFGIGFQMDAGGRSPSGKFEVSMKVGGKLPKYAIIEKLTPTGQLGYPTLSGPAYMTSRILVLNGLDKTPNYDNTNTLYRHVYIHGTNREARLGQRASEGCFRISNDDSIELFSMIDTGIHYYAVPNNAWPAESEVAAVVPVPAPVQAINPHPMTPSECTARCGWARGECYKGADSLASQTPAGQAFRIKLINNCNMNYGSCCVTCQFLPPGLGVESVAQQAVAEDSDVAAVAATIDLISQLAEEVAAPHPMRPSECVSRCSDSRTGCYQWADGFASQTPAGRALHTKLVNNCGLQYNQCCVVCQSLPPGPSVAASNAVLGPKSRIHKMLGLFRD